MHASVLSYEVSAVKKDSKLLRFETGVSVFESFHLNVIEVYQKLVVNISVLNLSVSSNSFNEGISRPNNSLDLIHSLLEHLLWRKVLLKLLLTPLLSLMPSSFKVIHGINSGLLVFFVLFFLLLLRLGLRLDAFLQCISIERCVNDLGKHFPNQLLFKWEPEVKVMTLHSICKEVSGLSFFLEAIEVFVVED